MGDRPCILYVSFLFFFTLFQGLMFNHYCATGTAKVSLSVEFSATLPTLEDSFRILYKSQVATAARVMVEAVTIEDIRAGKSDMKSDTFIVVSTVKFQDDGICTKANTFDSTLNYGVDLFPLQSFIQYGEVTAVADVTCGTHPGIFQLTKIVRPVTLRFKNIMTLYH
jgi:hypothetical protein